MSIKRRLAVGCLYWKRPTQVFLLTPYSGSLKRRLVKRPKLYFYDVGLASSLLDLRNAGHVASHPLRGALFENLVVADIFKESAHADLPGQFLFYRDHRGLEIDLLIERGLALTAIEIKNSQTFRPDFLTGMRQVRQHVPGIERMFCVYGGTDSFETQGVAILPLKSIRAVLNGSTSTAADAGPLLL